MPGIYESLFGKSGEIRAMPTMSEEQQKLLGQLLGGLGGPLQQGLGNLGRILGGDVSAYEKPAISQFQQEIVPQLAEQFAGMGAGAQSSSAFQQALGGAGANLAERLAMQRAQLQSGALGQLGGLLGQGLGAKTFDYQQIPGSQGALAPIVGGLGSGIGSGLGMGIGGLFGRLFGG